jgi:L-fucose isomerase-like protein
MKQSIILSIDPEPGRKETVEQFFGITTRPLSTDIYNKEFSSTIINKNATDFIDKLTKESIEVRRITKESFEWAAKSYFAMRTLMERESADAVTMNCLKVGLGRPCIGFSILNNQMIPAICENDVDATYGQMIGQLVTGRPGFQHNPCYETEKNHYYASHCTSPTKIYGPDDTREMKYLLTPYFHTNDGTCCIQVFWNPGDPVTMIHYYPGEHPELDVYAGSVYASHQMPPAGGCSTNVEIEIIDRSNSNQVVGSHNLLFAGDFSRRFKNFAQLHKLPLKQEIS